MFYEGSVGLGRGPTNDGEGFFVSAHFKCFRNGVWGKGGGQLMMMKESLFQLISKCFYQEWRKNHFSWWALQETIDYFRILWDLVFRKSFFAPTVLKLMIYSYQEAPQTSSLQCLVCYLTEVEPFLIQICFD